MRVPKARLRHKIRDSHDASVLFSWRREKRTACNKIPEQRVNGHKPIRLDSQLSGTQWNIQFVCPMMDRRAAQSFLSLLIVRTSSLRSGRKQPVLSLTSLPS